MVFLSERCGSGRESCEWCEVFKKHALIKERLGKKKKSTGRGEATHTSLKENKKHHDINQRKSKETHCYINPSGEQEQARRGERNKGSQKNRKKRVDVSKNLIPGPTSPPKDKWNIKFQPRWRLTSNKEWNGGGSEHHLGWGEIPQTSLLPSSLATSMHFKKYVNWQTTRGDGDGVGERRG